MHDVFVNREHDSGEQRMGPHAQCRRDDSIDRQDNSRQDDSDDERLTCLPKYPSRYFSQNTKNDGGNQ